MRKLFKNEDAFTGLEAAIVLIAFIVVAAVFSYVMLGAGFFATQEAQRSVHTGSQQASSSLEIIGAVYGMAGVTTADAEKGGATATDSHLKSIKFTIGNTAGGTPIDVTQMLVTFVCGSENVVIPFDGAKSQGALGLGDGEFTALKGEEVGWKITETFNDVGGKNKLLEPGEQFVMEVEFAKTGDKTVLTPNTRFSVNLQPALGAGYPIKKTVPSTIYAVNVL